MKLLIVQDMPINTKGFYIVPWMVWCTEGNVYYVYPMAYVYHEGERLVQENIASIAIERTPNYGLYTIIIPDDVSFEQNPTLPAPWKGYTKDRLIHVTAVPK